MNDPEHPPTPVPKIVVRRQRRLPLVWLIPIVAAVVAGSLWVQALRERGHEIVITFATAEGLEPGKTRIKSKDVQLGRVDDVRLTDDLAGVVVTATMSPASEPFLVSDTRFWVVRPRIGRGGVSGLGTLVSGAYIEIDPSREGTPTHAFNGLESPPLTPVNAPGLKIQLRAERRGSLAPGSAVYHRQIEVGYIERQRWDDDFESVLFDVYVEQPYTGLIRENTRFWNTSGVSVELGADGFAVKAESLDSLVSGGVSFALPTDHLPGPPAAPGHSFELHDDERAAMGVYEEQLTYVLHFEESVRGLSEGAPVEYRGVRVGTVRSIDAVYDRESLQLRTPVLIDIEPERFDVLGGPDRELTLEERRANVQGLVARGLRARLEVANLLTGALFVAFDAYPDDEPRYTGGDHGLIEIPTVPSSGAALGETLAQLPEVMSGLRGSIDSIARLLGGEQLESTLASVDSMAANLAALSGTLDDEAPELLQRLDATLDEAQLLIGALRTDAPALLARADQTLGKADGALDGLAGAGDGAGRELTLALRELSATLSSVRQLVDYLERHPEALLQGKDSP